MAEELVTTQIENELDGQIKVLTPEEAQTHLLQLGRSKGFVSYDDVLKVMPEVENNIEQLEDIFANLFEQGIEVGQKEEIEEEEPDEIIETVEEEEEFDLSQIEIDDSISLYLKEIGRVPCSRQRKKLIWQSGWKKAGFLARN